MWSISNRRRHDKPGCYAKKRRSSAEEAKKFSNSWLGTRVPVFFHRADVLKLAQVKQACELRPSPQLLAMK
jgi:hypothetical protein